MEPTSQVRQASAANQASSRMASEVLKARVVTRSLGVRLGGFGVDYTSRQVVLDPEASAGEAPLREAARTLTDSVARSQAAERVHDASWREPAPDVPPAPDHPDPAWRKGLRAYAKARDLLLTDASASGRSSLAVA